MMNPTDLGNPLAFPLAQQKGCDILYIKWNISTANTQIAV